MKSVIILNGSSLTIEQIVLVAREGASVEIAPEAQARIRRTRDMVLAMAQDRAMPRIYGFNTGVGMNKDWDISRGRPCRLQSHAHSFAQRRRGP